MNTRKRTRNTETIPTVVQPNRGSKSKKVINQIPLESNNSDMVEPNENVSLKNENVENMTISNASANLPVDENKNEIKTDPETQTAETVTSTVTNTVDIATAQTSSEQTSEERLNESKPDIVANTSQVTNENVQSSSRTNRNHHFDDSVILIDDGSMPRPTRCDEDVIFVDEYVPHQRITAVVDLCAEEDSSPKKQRTPPQPVAQLPSVMAQQLAQMSPIASTSTVGVKCPICLDQVPNNEVYSTLCGHLFCYQCIENAARVRKKCPMCNKQLTKNKIHRIFLH